MSSNIEITLHAQDDASAVIANAGKNMSSAADQISNSAKQASLSMKDLAVDLSGVTSGALNLYYGFDRINTTSLTLEKSNLAVSRATTTLNVAQQSQAALLTKNAILTQNVALAQAKLATAQSDSAVSITEIGKAESDLADAQGALAKNQQDVDNSVNTLANDEDALTLKTQQAEQAAKNQQLAIITGAATAIPSIVTLGNNFGNLMSKIKDTTFATDLLSGSITALDALTLVGIGGVFVGLGLLVSWVLSQGKETSAPPTSNAPLYAAWQEQQAYSSGTSGNPAMFNMPPSNVTAPTPAPPVYAQSLLSAESQVDKNFSNPENNPNEMMRLVTFLINTAQNIGLHSTDVTAALRQIGAEKGWRLDQISAGQAMVPSFAGGAYISSPTFALVGEAGPEIVSPESKMREIMSENKGNVINIKIDSTNNITINGETDLDNKVAKMLNENNDKLINDLQRHLA